MILLLLIGIGCSDTDIASMKSIGDPGHITCFSGGTVIYDGSSTGKIETETQSDGWKFMDSKTQRLVRVSGDCVITN